MTVSIRLVSWLVFASMTCAYSQQPHSLHPDLAAPGTPELTKRQGGDVFGEGVAADWQGNVYFNEMFTNKRTMRVAVGEDSARVWREANDNPNGMWLDTQNRLIICQQRAIVRVKPGATFDNQTDTLFKYEGQDFNDVTGDSKDNFFFTNFNGGSVYFRRGLTGKTDTVLTGRPKPNGIEWDEERKIIYVCENGTGKVAAYDVGTDFSLKNRRDFDSIPNPDGIVLDDLGNVYSVSFGFKVSVRSPSGAKLGDIPINGSQMTNLAFGGADFKTLFMITEKGLYKLPMKVRGYKSGQPVSLLKPRRVKPLSDLFWNSTYQADGKSILPLNNASGHKYDFATPILGDFKGF